LCKFGFSGVRPIAGIGIHGNLILGIHGINLGINLASVIIVFGRVRNTSKTFCLR